MKEEVPDVECYRCRGKVPIIERLVGLNNDRICEECATEKELNSWNDYVDDMEEEVTVAQERDMYGG